MPKKVFISYAHESEDFSNKVLEFSDFLRSKGIDAEIDQYEESPPEGWPKWMMRQVHEADFVLVCCSELFHTRATDFKNSESGLGVKWETNLILQELYTNSTSNTKYIPIFFDSGNNKFIPLPLQPYTHYNVSKENEKTNLINRLLGLSKSKRPTLGSEPEAAEEIKPLESKERKSLFFSTIIDLDLWNSAKWKGMAFVSDPGLQNPPIACFVFANEKAGAEIFKKLRKEFGEVDSSEEIRLSFIEKINPSKPADYKVHIGSERSILLEKLKKYGLKPDESLLVMLSRIQEMNPPRTPSSLTIFKHSYHHFKKYYITNLITQNGQLTPDFNNIIEKKNVHFREKSDVVKDRNDDDIVVFKEFHTKPKL